MLRIAGLADNLDNFIIHEARDGMIHHSLAPRAVIINQIPKAQWTVIKP